MVSDSSLSKLLFEAESKIRRIQARRKNAQDKRDLNASAASVPTSSAKVSRALAKRC